VTAPTVEILQQVDEQNRIARAIEREFAIQNPEEATPEWRPRIRMVLPEEIIPRAERGYQLYMTRRPLITHAQGDTYTVPSCRGGDTYTVHYGGDTVEAHYSCLQRPCACLSGLVFITIEDENGEERDASYRCTRCGGEER
jgi:hypothetical protein